MSEQQRPDFFFAAMSPYSWLAAERIGRLLPSARWQAVFAGGLFHAAGRQSWGVTDRRESEMAECERRAHAYGLGAMRWPARWPTNDLTVARALTFAARGAPAEDAQRLLRRLALEAMRLSFLGGEDLGELEVVLEAGRRAGIEEQALQLALGEQELKLALRESTDAALARGVIGVPTVTVGEQLFWGDDQLERAAAAAAQAGERAQDVPSAPQPGERAQT